MLASTQGRKSGMSDSTGDGGQLELQFDTEEARSLLDQLLIDSRLYTQSKDYKDLLDFVIRLRNFAPFNAMLLQIQKPGLLYAASAPDWRERFGRGMGKWSRTSSPKSADASGSLMRRTSSSPSPLRSFAMTGG